jgi:hypothetical protein
LEIYGTVDKFNALIKSYLKERYQRVLTGNKNTHNSTTFGWKKVKYGVPQGSTRGPLFFLFYVNDLPKITTKKVKLVLNADDTSIIATNRSPKYLISNMNKVFEDKN